MPDDLSFAFFSTRELFADFDRVDAEWLDTLIKVQQILPVAMLFFRLSGFWRQDWAIATITQPTLVVVGDTASSISRQAGQKHQSKEADYLKYLPKVKVLKL